MKRRKPVINKRRHPRITKQVHWSHPSQSSSTVCVSRKIHSRTRCQRGDMEHLVLKILTRTVTEIEEMILEKGERCWNCTALVQRIARRVHIAEARKIRVQQARVKAPSTRARRAARSQWLVLDLVQIEMSVRGLTGRAKRAQVGSTRHQMTWTTRASSFRENWNYSRRMTMARSRPS